jgi:hypothetical protein
MRLGWVLMPCRECGVAPGDPCLERPRRTKGLNRRYRIDKPHAIRERDADRASELL